MSISGEIDGGLTLSDMSDLIAVEQGLEIESKLSKTNFQFRDNQK